MQEKVMIVVHGVEAAIGYTPLLIGQCMGRPHAQIFHKKIWHEI